MSFMYDGWSEGTLREECSRRGFKTKTGRKERLETFDELQSRVPLPLESPAAARKRKIVNVKEQAELDRRLRDESGGGTVEHPRDIVERGQRKLCG
jgi:hypothetical protein